MSKNRRKGRTRAPRHTPLKKLRKKGSKLLSPYSELNVEPVSWNRDLLPEHLWIGALAETVGIDSLHRAFEAFLDAIDEYWPEDEKNVCLGLISDFSLVPEASREGFLSSHGQLARELFWDPIGAALLLYPDCPAAWLAAGIREERDGSVDPAEQLPRLRALVSKLLESHGEFTTRVRLVPFGRPLKHGKVFFKNDLPTVDLLPGTPRTLQNRSVGRWRASSARQ